MAMMTAMRSAALVLMTLALAACGRSESYRYKLTLVVNTPAGVKRASMVGEELFRDVAVPARGTMHRLRGEALYLDLGPGKRPLVALLSRHILPFIATDYENERWGRDGGPNIRLMCRLYGLAPSKDYMDDVPRIARLRGAHNIAPANLPNLVTFADVNDPKTVIEIDPDDLQATLGPGISWNEITLESTDEPVTTGIETKLIWIPAYHDKMLDGDTLRHGRTLSNSLSIIDFEQSGE